MWKRRRLRDKNRQIIFRDVSEKKSKRVDIAPIFLLQKFAEHAYIHDKYFRLIGWTLAEPNMVPNLREQSVDAAYWYFFEASFKLGRITDCDPKVGKNLMQACLDWDLLGYPSYFPFVHCEYSNGQ